MSILSAFNSALSGLDAQAAGLANISNNVANASTVGYKQANTEFDSMVLNGGAGGSPQLAGVSSATRMDIGTAGQLQATGVNTDLAINGNGFMVVNTAATASSGNYLLTRAGSFRPDASGNLQNAAGYYLQGQPVNAQGNIIGTPADNVAGLSTVNVANLSVAATPTTAMTFTANLPSTETGYAAIPPTPSSTSEVYYDGLGTPQTLQFQFVPTTAATAGAANTNTWTMNIFDSASATPATPIGSATLAFNASGANAGTLQAVTPVGGGAYDPNAGTFTVTTGSGTSLPITIGALNSSNGMSQLDGAYQTTKIAQNGSAFGLLQGVSIGNNGVVTASFTNGTNRPIYQVDLVVVPNEDGLTPQAGDAYALNTAAGVPQLFQPGTGPAGDLDSGSLEGSNVDITTQLTNMIETQRAYSSTAAVIHAADLMMQTATQLAQP
jgi:flagellar hook protein FlgE